MTILVVPSPDGQSWSETYFSGMSPLHLGVAAKTWAEHLLDWCHSEGATAVKVMDFFYDEALLRGHLSRPERWGFRLSYEGANEIASEEEAVRRSRAFAGDDGDVRVVWGPVFPYRGGWVRLDSLRAWFEFNFRVLADPADRILPGYSAEPGVSVGENVMVRTHARVERPVALGDNVRIEDEAALEGDVIVGNGTFVERKCRLRRTVVFSHGYLGRDLSFEGKVVYGSRVIDVESESFVDLSEPGLSSRFRHGTTMRPVDVWEWAIALALSALMLLPAALLWGVRRSAWGYKLSIARYPLILRAALLRKRLIRLSAKDGTCAFRASDAMSVPRTAEERRLDDIWYRCSRTPWFATAVVAKALLYRLCAPAGREERGGER